VLAESSVIEKMLRVLLANPRIDAIALAEDEQRLPTFRLLSADQVGRATLGALGWATTGAAAPPSSLELPGRLPLQALARWLSAHATVQWRHLPRRDRRAVRAPGAEDQAAIGAPRHNRSRDAGLRTSGVPQLPGLEPGIATRLRWPNVWTPPHARLLCRHLQLGSGRYLYTNDLASPPGCSLHYTLGCVRGLPLLGTTSLTSADGDPSVLNFGEDTQLDAPELLGFVERAPLPLFDPLLIGRHRETGQHVLIAGAADPLAGLTADVVGVGYIEPYPIHPRQAPHIDVGYGLIGLVRTVDLRARRHRYGAGQVPAGVPAGELGALFGEPTGDCEPFWIEDQWPVSLDENGHRSRRPRLRTAIRWTGAPLSWRGSGPLGPRFRATARRGFESARRVIAPGSANGSPRPEEPAGYLLRAPTRGSLPLYASIHPVTGDQLLSTEELEPRDLGYGSVTLLGYLLARAPVTGTLGPIQVGVPWASRFGRRV
jgi:hypothetical protein